jgi:hypothetical protein
MSFRRLSLLLLLGVLACTVRAEDGAQEAADDAYDQYYSNNGQKNWDGYGAGDDYITYWTDFAILPKRCIVQ